jgi:hypothetical protein
VPARTRCAPVSNDWRRRSGCSLNSYSSTTAFPYRVCRSRPSLPGPDGLTTRQRVFICAWRARILLRKINPSNVRECYKRYSGAVPRQVHYVNRTSLVVALLIAVAAGSAFTLYPTIDLSIAGLVYEATNASNGAWAQWLLLITAVLREIGLWIEILLSAPSVVASWSSLRCREPKCSFPAGRLSFFSPV